MKDTELLYKCYELPKEELEEKFKLFSEGDENLLSLLRLCYDNKLNIINCCKSYGESNRIPFISFIYEQNSKEILDNLMHEMVLDNKGLAVIIISGENISYNENKEKQACLPHFTISAVDNNVDIFKHTLTLLNKILNDNLEYDNYLSNAIKNCLDYHYRNLTSLRFSINCSNGCNNIVVTCNWNRASYSIRTDKVFSSKTELDNKTTEIYNQIQEFLKKNNMSIAYSIPYSKAKDNSFMEDFKKHINQLEDIYYEIENLNK